MEFNFRWVPTGFGNVKVRGDVYLPTKAGHHIKGIKITENVMIICPKKDKSFSHRMSHTRMVLVDEESLRN